MESSNNHSKKIIFFLIFFSLLLHGLLGILIYFFLPLPLMQEPVKEKTQVLWIKPELIPSHPEITDLAKPDSEKKPEHTNRVSEFNSSVKKEQVAAPQMKPKIVQRPLKPREKVEKEVSEAPQKPKEAKQEKEKKVEKVQEEKQELKKEKTPEKETPQFSEKPEAEHPSHPDLENLKLKPQDVFSKEQPKSNPSEKMLALKSHGSGLEYRGANAYNRQSEEYYPDYTIGGRTYLNALRMQDVGYFSKMKRILKMRWNPIPSVRSYLMSQHNSKEEIECTIGLGLNESGKITDLIVIKSSGVSGYDQEAMQTIRESSPFSSPPTEYIKNGKLLMSWTFIVYL